MSQKIVFLYGGPLDRERRTLAELRGFTYPSVKEVKEKVEDWKTIWADVNQGERVLTRFSELTGMTLPYPVEAYMIGGLFNAMSRPFVMMTHKRNGTAYTKDELIDICLHEVAHQFTSPRDEDARIDRYRDTLAEIYANEKQITRVHT